MRKLFSNKWIYYIGKHKVTNSVIKMTIFAHGGISIKLFVVNLHIINECLSYKFHHYLILTGAHQSLISGVLGVNDEIPWEFSSLCVTPGFSDSTTYLLTQKNRGHSSTFDQNSIRIFKSNMY